MQKHYIEIIHWYWFKLCDELCIIYGR